VVSRYWESPMCISRREPTPCGGGVSYAPPSCPGHHVHVDGSSLMAANTVFFDAGTTASNTKRCGAWSRKSRSTVRKRWAMTHNVDSSPPPVRSRLRGREEQIGGTHAGDAVQPHGA